MELQVKPGAEQGLEETYNETFRPAILQQEGFLSVSLLRPREESQNYLLSIVFNDQVWQQKWVATDLHQRVWSQMESHCVSYAVRSYDPV
ncbi:MAG: antibiotic biosynthesis monooxygenase [Terriglobia bacterium]